MNCIHCGQPIVGGKGDYWHINSVGGFGEMRCADGMHLAEPPKPVTVERERFDDQCFLLHGVAERDPNELVCMVFPSVEARDEFKRDLPGRYAELTIVGIDYDAVELISY